MTARCPSDLALERLLLEPGKSPHQPHVDQCARCAARLGEMRRQGEDFLRFVFPATVEKVEQAAVRRPFWSDRVRWLAPLPALAAAAAILILARPLAPPDDYLGEKGGGSLGLGVFLRSDAGARPAKDGQPVPAAAALRFKVRPAKPCNLWVVSVDGRGQVSRLYPAAGPTGADVVRPTELPGGAILDGQPGPERIMAVCTPEPLPFDRIVDTVHGAMDHSVEKVRTVRSVPGFPDGTSQDSVLLEKTP